jgi:hypothetical protein
MSPFSRVSRRICPPAWLKGFHNEGTKPRLLLSTGENQEEENCCIQFTKRKAFIEA